MKSEENKFQKKLGEFLEKKRKNLNLSREELAGKLGIPITRVTIANLEKGVQKIAFEHLVHLSRNLNFSIEEVVEMYDQESLQSSLDQESDAVKSTLEKYL